MRKIVFFSMRWDWSMALGPINHSLAAKATSKLPKPTRLPIIGVLVHGKVPAQCMAITKQDKAAAASSAPTRSVWASLLLKGVWRRAPAGGEKKTIIISAAIAPTGRFTLLGAVSSYMTSGDLVQCSKCAYQKHHRQPGPSVKAPPISGPITLAHPKVTPRTPM